MAAGGIIDPIKGYLPDPSMASTPVLDVNYGLALYRPIPAFEIRSSVLRNGAGETPKEWAARIAARADELIAHGVVPWPVETMAVEAEIAEWEAIRDNASHA